MHPTTSLLAYIDPTGGLPPNLWGMMLAGVLAALGVAWASMKMFGRQLLYYVAPWRKVILIAAAVVLLSAASGFAMFSFLKRGDRAGSGGNAGGARVLILGFDGLDPGLVDKYMAEGRLPNFARLKKEGLYHPLGTTTPPQSPVAWSTFITGVDPGQHGVFDFLKRDPKTYMLDLTTSDRKRNAVSWKGTPFWNQGAVAEQGMVGLRVPVTFPPSKLNGRLLAGMGVWDVRGTEGQYFFYTLKPWKGEEKPRGMVFEFTRDGEALTGGIPGPYTFGDEDKLREPFRLDLTEGGGKLTLQGKTTELRNGRWSDWVSVEFRLGALGLQRARGVTRVILRRDGDNVTLYVSPLNFDPVSPGNAVSAISYPKDYSAELAKAIGTFHTRGMPFDSQAVSDGVLSDDDFLEQCRTIDAEGAQMLTQELTRFESGVLFAYFESSDIVQHMFWRGIDPDHPLANSEDAKAHRDAIPQVYERLDGVLGQARASLGQRGGTVVVISDHGFAPFRRSVHLNSILRDLGFLTLKEGDTASELFGNVDWSKTQAYALGFNTIFLNLAGREGKGIVKPEEADALAKRIAQGLEAFTDPETKQKPIKKVYLAAEAYPGSADPNKPDLVVGYVRGYRTSWETALGAAPSGTVSANNKKWSGDHLIDPTEVPGVFLTSDPKLDAKTLAEVGGAVNAYLVSNNARP